MSLIGVAAKNPSTPVRVHSFAVSNRSASAERSSWLVLFDNCALMAAGASAPLSPPPSRAGHMSVQPGEARRGKMEVHGYERGALDLERE